MRLIDILIFDDVNLLDVAGPAQAFASAMLDGQCLYSTRFVSIDGAPVTSSCGLRMHADSTLTLNSDAMDLLIPGGQGVDAIMQLPLLHQVIGEWNKKLKGRRLISVCSGSLVLASAGVLDGLKATTHWTRSQQAVRQFPRVNWLIDELYVFEKDIFTSAGVTTGIDLTLALIQNDHGGQCALDVARELVVYMQRDGKQSQFAGVVDVQLQPSDTMSMLVQAIVENPEREWSVAQMAAFCHLTERTLTRRCHKHLNLSPKRFVEKVRVSKACEWISTGMPLGLVISRSGLSDKQQMNRAFKRQIGTSVSDYVERFSA